VIWNKKVPRQSALESNSAGAVAVDPFRRGQVEWVATQVGTRSSRTLRRPSRENGEFSYQNSPEEKTKHGS